MRFEDFNVGDYVWFEKTFSQDEFKLFAELSGDRNPLHHDKDKAKASVFGQTIVPMHMVAAPLSRIAGMIFPGEPSLYLGTQWRMPQPAFFGVPTFYSARISAISQAQRVLEIKTFAVQGRKVVFEATQHVNARDESWETPPELPVRRADEARRVVVTGAGGEIGRAIALRLARAGYSLFLLGRKADERLAGLARDCENLGAKVLTAAADLTGAPGRAAAAEALSKADDIAAIVHAASPGVHAPLHELVDVNFTAFEALTNAVLDGMLRRQAGIVLFIGSAAVETHPQGWEAYAGAKAIGTSYCQGIDAAYGRYGVSGRVLAPGFVRTAMSKDLRPPQVEALLPEEVADQVAAMLARPTGAMPYVSMRPGEMRDGQFGFTQRGAIPPGAGSGPAHPPEGPAVPSRPQASAQDDGDLLTLVAGFLNIADTAAVRDGGIDITAGWDSLRHIELMLEVEQRRSIRFTAGEIEQAKTYRGLEKLVRDKTT